MPTILEAAGVKIPKSVTGRSLFKAIKGEKWREFIHGEHSPCYSLKEAMHYLTDAKEKYIYFPATGKELFFDLKKDRQEIHNLSKDSAYANQIKVWRKRLIDLLAERDDGFSDGKKLLLKKKGWKPIAEENISKKREEEK